MYSQHVAVSTFYD